MALTFRALYKNCNFIRHLSVIKPVKWSTENYPVRFLAGRICYLTYTNKPLIEVKQVGLLAYRQCSTQSCPNPPKPPEEPAPKKQGLMQRLKVMYRDYWYVVLPVHLVTSAIWFGGFYYAVRSGVDAIAILQSIGVSESLIAPLKQSGAGYVALALALYKVITPLRYAVTVGGTTYAIKKLTAIGWLKPVPSKARIKEMIQDSKGNLQDRFNESKHHYQTMKSKSTRVMDEMRRYKTEIRNMKSKVKKM